MALALGVSASAQSMGPYGPGPYIPSNKFVFSNVLSGSAITPSSATPVDITSVSLGAGTWDCTGQQVANLSTGVVTRDQAWVNTVSATVPSPTNGSAVIDASTIPAAVIMQYALGTARITLAASGTVFLSTSVTFTGAAPLVFGYLRCTSVE